jgi:hypothetical protein
MYFYLGDHHIGVGESVNTSKGIEVLGMFDFFRSAAMQHLPI